MAEIDQLIDQAISSASDFVPLTQRIYKVGHKVDMLPSPPPRWVLNVSPQEESR